MVAALESCVLQSDASLEGWALAHSDRERQLQKLLEPWKEAGFVGLVLIQHASRHWYRLSWK